MVKLLGVDIAKEIHKALSPRLLPLFLIKLSPGTRGTSLTAGIEPVEDSYAGRGFISDYLDRHINGTSVVTGDRKVNIIGNSLPARIIPISGDRVTIEGFTYNIVRVTRDPAAAMYTCQVRGPANVTT